MIVPLLTVATLESLVDHVTVLFVALLGVIVAVIVLVSPLLIVTLVGDTDIPVTFTMSGFSLTVIFAVAVRPLTVLAVIVAVPLDIPVTFPPLTVATSVLFDVHNTVLSVASLGAIVAVKLTVFPSSMLALVLLSVIPVGRTWLIGTSPISSAAPPSLRYSPLGITLPGAGVLFVLSTYTLIFPFPETFAVNEPPSLTVFVSPVTASTYVPPGRFVNVASPEIVTRAKLSVVESV